MEGRQLILVFWLIFIAYWVLSTREFNANLFELNYMWWRWLAVIVALVLVRRVPFLQVRLAPQTAVDAGIVMCAAGIGFAIWARRYLGINWSIRPAVRKGHELITSGPYAITRHPIYSGLLLAMLGSAMADGVLWAIIFLVVGVGFIHRAKLEEALMTQQFPDQYPAYKRRTRAFIPFVV